MKIQVDKNTRGPGYNLTKADVIHFWPVLPPEWTNSVECVRLCNQVGTLSIAEFSYVTKQLNIWSWYRTKRDILWSVAAELLLHHTLTHPTPLGRLSHAERKKLDVEISPLVDLLLNSLETVPRRRLIPWTRISDTPAEADVE